MAKIGPCTKVHVRCPETSDLLLNNVCHIAGDIRRHQIRRELNAFEHQPEDLGHRSHKQCFRRTGQTGDQAVAANEQSDTNLFDDFFLANNHPMYLPDDLVIDFSETRDSRLQCVRFKLRDHGCGHELFSVFSPSLLALLLVAADFKQQLLRRPEIRRGFQSGDGFLSGLVFLARGLEGLCPRL